METLAIVVIELSLTVVGAYAVYKFLVCLPPWVKGKDMVVAGAGGLSVMIGQMILVTMSEVPPLYPVAFIFFGMALMILPKLYGLLRDFVANGTTHDHY